MRFARTCIPFLFIAPLSLPVIADPAARSFDFTYTATVKEVPAGAKRLDLWIPVPPSDAHQSVELRAVESPLPFEYQAEAEYGNRVLHAWSDAPMPASVTLRFRCERREHRHLPGASGDAGKPDVSDRPSDRFLKPDRLGIVDDVVRRMADEVTTGRSDAVTRSRAIYDFVQEKMVYDKSGQGWGRGDTRYACEVGKGNCTDFHALFISLARATKIPSRFEIGFSIPTDKAEGPIGGYHCWGEFWVPDFGWVPVDCSEGWKQKDKRDYFYGAHDENRVQFTVGRDIVLPGMKGEPLNFFVYPYAEIDGKPAAGVEKAFAFKAIAADPAAPSEGAGPGPAPSAAPPKAEPPKSSGLELAVGEAKIRFYGFLRLDFLYDDSHPNNTQTIVFIRSEDPNAPAAFGEEKNAEDLTIHPRLTRFGVDVSGPAIEALWGAQPMGKIEFDFYNNSLAGQAESRAAIRMRHAYVKLAWPEAAFLAGQTADIIAPIWPVVNADMVMWGAGNLGDRRPMLMGEVRPALGSGNLIVQTEVGLTGADDNQNADAAGGGVIRDGEASGFPTFQGRLAYNGAHPWVEKKRFEAGVWGHFAKERLDKPPAGAERDYTSHAEGFDVRFPICDWLEVQGEGWRGANVDDVRGGIFQGINVAQEEEIASRGYWLETVVRPVAWYALHLGASRDDPVNNDVAPASATTGMVDNRIWYLANRFNAGAGLSFGLDWMRWTTQWRGGFADGTDNRFNLLVQYGF